MTVAVSVTVTQVREDGSEGPADVALAAVDRLEDKLASYHAYHATRADLLRRLGHSHKSRAAHDKAIELAGNTAETALYRFRTRHGGCDLRFGRMSRLGQDRGLCLFASSI